MGGVCGNEEVGEREEVQEEGACGEGVEWAGVWGTLEGVEGCNGSELGGFVWNGRGAWEGGGAWGRGHLQSGPLAAQAF